MRRRFGLAAVLVVIVAWNAALIAAPTGPAGVSALTYLAGAHICHQRPERSFHRANAQYPVCARCHGLYAGAALGVIGWLLASGGGPVARDRALRLVRADYLRRGLILTALPTGLSVSLDWIGVWDGSNISRALLALPLGGMIAAITAAVAARDLR